MTFLRSIVLLVGVCLCIAFAFFVGHGLSTGHTAPLLYGTAVLLAGAAVLAGLSRKRTHW
ncbi:MAG TPA: hypothetical protein VHG09_04815 [Longimicrobiales bacterium]|nr:hypothetical protein [Longimicrobiales bacterium]